MSFSHEKSERRLLRHRNKKKVVMVSNAYSGLPPSTTAVLIPPTDKFCVGGNAEAAVAPAGVGMRENPSRISRCTAPEKDARNRHRWRLGGDADRDCRRRQRQQQYSRHRGAPPAPPPKPRTTAGTSLSSVLLTLFSFTATLPRSTATTTADWQRHRRLQNSTEASVPPCSSAGETYSVSLPADAAELTVALAACTGGVYDVTWTGNVLLDEPLVVASGSSLTITGAPGVDGTPPALDGGGATGLVDLGTGSSLRLEGVALRNGWRNVGNGGAVRAEAAGCSVSALDSAFEGNEAAAGLGGALALGSGATAELENCVVSGNSALRSGGGVYAEGDGCSVVFRGGSLEDNTAGGEGGGAQIEGRSTAVFDGSTVWRNSALDEGGGVYGINATVVVVGGTEFVNNTAGWYGGGGIGLWVSSLADLLSFCVCPGWVCGRVLICCCEPGVECESGFVFGTVGLLMPYATSYGGGCVGDSTGENSHGVLAYATAR